MVKEQNIGTKNDPYIAGDSMQINVTITENGNPKDLTGATISFGVGNDYGNPVELGDGDNGVNINITNESDGEVEIIIDDGVTSDLVGYWIYEIEVEDAAGQVVTVTRGNFVIEDELV